MLVFLSCASKTLCDTGADCTSSGRIRSDGAVLCDGAGVAWRGRGRVREGVVSGVGEQ